MIGNHNGMFVTCLAVFFSVSCIAFGRVVLVECDSCLNTVRSSDNLCSVKRIWKEIYAKEGEITAPKPKWNQTEWYSYAQTNHTRALALNLTWSQKGAFFKQTTGYVLSILRTSADKPRLYHIVVKLDPNLSDFDQVVINYPCFGRSDDNYVTVRPGQAYALKLRSLPSYFPNSDHRNNEVNKEIDIPGCYDADLEINQVEECIENQIYDYSADGFEQNYTFLVDQSGDGQDDKNKVTRETTNRIPVVNLALIIAGLLFALIAAYLCICFWLRSRKSEGYFQGSTHKPILFLISRIGAAESNDLYVDVADLLIGSLERGTDVTIHSNVRETPIEPISWMEDKLKSCGRVVLVFSPLGKLNYKMNNDKDPFVIAINKLLEETKRNFLRLSNSNKFFALYLDDNVTACIPEILISKRIKCIHVPTKLAWFYDRVAGIKLDAVPSDHIASMKSKFNSINTPTEKANGSIVKKNVNIENGKGPSTLNGEVVKLVAVNVLV